MADFFDILVLEAWSCFVIAILMALVCSLSLPPLLPLARAALVRSEILLCSNSGFAHSWNRKLE